MLNPCFEGPSEARGDRVRLKGSKTVTIRGLYGYYNIGALIMRIGFSRLRLFEDQDLEFGLKDSGLRGLNLEYRGLVA